MQSTGLRQEAYNPVIQEKKYGFYSICFLFFPPISPVSHQLPLTESTAAPQGPQCWQCSGGSGFRKQERLEHKPGMRSTINTAALKIHPYEVVRHSRFPDRTHRPCAKQETSAGMGNLPRQIPTIKQQRSRNFLVWISPLVTRIPFDRRWYDETW